MPINISGKCYCTSILVSIQIRLHKLSNPTFSYLCMVFVRVIQSMLSLWCCLICLLSVHNTIVVLHIMVIDCLLVSSLHFLNESKHIFVQFIWIICDRKSLCLSSVHSVFMVWYFAIAWEISHLQKNILQNYSLRLDYLGWCCSLRTILKSYIHIHNNNSQNQNCPYSTHLFWIYPRTSLARRTRAIINDPNATDPRWYLPIDNYYFLLLFCKYVF